jgi:hypothetical protein
MLQPHNWPSDLARAVVEHWSERPSVADWRALLRAFVSIEFYRDQRNFGVMWVLANPGKILTHPDRNDDQEPTTQDRAVKRLNDQRDYWRPRLVPDTPSDLVDAIVSGRMPDDELDQVLETYGTEAAKAQRKAGFL